MPDEDTEAADDDAAAKKDAEAATSAADGNKKILVAVDDVEGVIAEPAVNHRASNVANGA
jgi:hypothetical protein